MGSLSIVTNEKQLIRCLIQQPSLVLQIEEDMFLSETGSTLYRAITELHNRQVPITAEHLLSEGNRINGVVTADVIAQLMSTEFDLASFTPYYLPRLRSDFARQEINTIVTQDLRVVVESKGELDLVAVRKHLALIDQQLLKTESKRSLIYSSSEAADQYTMDVMKRNGSQSKHRSGCNYLDKYLTVGMPPKNITTMFGATGTGKSAFALYLESRKINYRIPSIYISLEMDLISTFDRLCAMRRGIPLTSLHPEDGTIQPHIMDQVLDEMAALKRVKSFWFVEETGLCIKDVRSIVKDVKRFMGVDSLNVTIDLFTMLRDFSGKTAAEYEDGVNLMYEMGKQENIHQTWVVQANRKADSTRITSIDQINQLRPNRNTVKNSSAIMERSRIGLGIFRPRFYAETLFPDDPHLEMIDDLLEIQLLKQNQGESGEILKYNFRGSVFGISKWVGRAPLSPVVSASSSAPVAGDGST